jgi:hypothetical protein
VLNLLSLRLDSLGNSHTKSSSSWENEINCSCLTSNPDVRAYISAQKRTETMSGEDFLKHWDNFVMGGIFGTPVGLVSLGANIGQSLAKKLDIKTGKERESTISLPCGKVLVAILAYLVRENIKLESTEQFEEGCVLGCTIPSSVTTWKGELQVGVGKKGGGNTVVVAKVTFGQKFDWGRANRVLEKLFSAAAAGI